MSENNKGVYEKDVVLIYMEEAPVGFAQVVSIRPDVKKDWFIIELILLQIPLQAVSWILKAEYINGAAFKMDGKSMRLEKVIHPESSSERKPPLSDNAGETRGSSGDNTGEKDSDNLLRFPGKKR